MNHPHIDTYTYTCLRYESQDVFPRNRMHTLMELKPVAHVATSSLLWSKRIAQMFTVFFSLEFIDRTYNISSVKASKIQNQYATSPSVIHIGCVYTWKVAGQTMEASHLSAYGLPYQLLAKNYKCWFSHGSLTCNPSFSFM